MKTILIEGLAQILSSTGEEIITRPCLARTSGECPDQSSNLPSCHRCDLAFSDHMEIIRVLNEKGYFVGTRADKYPQIGCMLTVAGCRNFGTVTFEQFGDRREVSLIKSALQPRK